MATPTVHIDALRFTPVVPRAAGHPTFILSRSDKEIDVTCFVLRTMYYVLRVIVTAAILSTYNY